MISEQRTARGRVAYAAAWGIGHAAMLVLVGGLLMLLRARLPPRLDASFELTVSMMLIGLGGRAVRCAVIESMPREIGPHAHPRGHRGWRAIGPLAMGRVHGLAGSGALTALVVARLPSPTTGVVFMLLFGAGATLGMSLLAGAAGVPIGRLLRTRWGMSALLGARGGLARPRADVVRAGSHAPRGPLMAIYSHVRQSTRDAGSPQRRESRASVGAPTWGGTSPLATQPLDGYETCQEPRNQTSASVKGSRYEAGTVPLL
jgi:hypothetical protein